MDLDSITVDQFKEHFFRDFPYLKEYDNTELYNEGDEIYYPSSKLFYKCLVDGTTGVTPDSDASKWEKFSDDTLNYIQDRDIEKAFSEAQIRLNQGLFTSDKNITLGYFYLTAHYLVNDIRSGLAGVTAKPLFPVSSKSAGSVSESYGIPEDYVRDPNLSFFVSSPYGLKYLSIILPQLVGNIGTVAGATLP